MVFLRGMVCEVRSVGKGRKEGVFFPFLFHS